MFLRPENEVLPGLDPLSQVEDSTRWDHRHLTLAMLDHVANFSVMVDSSKTAWGSMLMPFRFHRDLGDDFLLVHLVRDPRGVCGRPLEPYVEGSRVGVELTRCLQTFFGWTFANLACEVFGLVHPSQYVRLHYEDRADAPTTRSRQSLPGRRLSLRILEIWLSTTTVTNSMEQDALQVASFKGPEGGHYLEDQNASLLPLPHSPIRLAPQIRYGYLRSCPR